VIADVHDEKNGLRATGVTQWLNDLSEKAS
jgi:hypothetical protein